MIIIRELVMKHKRNITDKAHAYRWLPILLFGVFAMTSLFLGPGHAADMDTTGPGAEAAQVETGSSSLEEVIMAQLGADQFDIELADYEGQTSQAQESEDIAAEGTIQTFTLKKDWGIRDALRFLAITYHKNIVPSPKVQGQLAFSKLFDVTFEEALDAIVGANFRYEQDGNLIKVYTAAEYKRIRENAERMIHRVFTLYYISAEEARKLLSPVLSDAASIETSTAAEKGVSIGDSGGSGGGDSLALQDMMSVYDYPENIAKAEEVVKAIDVRPKQVLVEATILSALLTERMELGVDLNLLGGVSLTGAAATETIATGSDVDQIGSAATTPISQVATGNLPGAMLEVAGFAAAGSSGLRIGVTSGNMALFITALESITDTTVLANPKILAVNKQEGSVLIGQKVGYRSQTTQTDTSTTQKVEFLETGTRLVFRPFIGDDGYIRIDIYPKDSSATLNEQGIPNETTAELRTNVIVRDGQTIVIGGLFRDVVTSGRQQIPLLGDIPLVGALFRGTNDTNQREEVIILLTPHIIEEPEQAEGQARAEDVNRKRYGARQMLQWLSRGRLAEDRYARAVQYYTDDKDVEALYELDGVLNLRPTYLEALRLKERIIRETAPDEAARIERIMLELIEREEVPNWRRR